jgi:dTDP-4-amino-4,6-dideoxygalactose transaminase
MRVPFVDLKAQYLAHRQEIDAAMAAVIADTAFIGGKFVRDFEASYAAAYGVRHCIGVANGTDAIYVVLRMLGIGAGDEVITTAASWISTSETITQAGARPVFVDVDEYFNIDVARLEQAITPRTRAIIPVHIFGQAARVDEIAGLCKSRGLLMIEDCAQAHFAERHGRRAGTFGVAATFSFYPGKNLGAYGDAGAIVTDDDELARRCRMYANHGALTKHQHQVEGINSRLDGMQAAILSAKLPHIAAWTAARQRVAARYHELLAGVPGLELPQVCNGSTHVYHLYVVRTARREHLREFLATRGIETAVHYPTPLPLLPAYAYLEQDPASVARAAENSQRMLSLPIFPEMTEEMIRHVCACVAEALVAR